MTAPPLPASPCLRVAIKYNHDTGLEAGSRFYLSYAGTAPSGSDCTTLATDIATKWGSDIMPNFTSVWTLAEVDVLDIASTSGYSGQWTGAVAGSAPGTSLPASAAVNIEFGVARRYRGGKPRMYLPPSNYTNTASDTTWNSGFVDAVATAVSGVMTYIEGLSIGSLGALRHVNLSYYSGFKNVTNTSGRTRAAPTYRATALVDNVTGYFGKTEISSQRRRRTSTTY